MQQNDTVNRQFSGTKWHSEQIRLVEQNDTVNRYNLSSCLKELTEESWPGGKGDFARQTSELIKCVQKMDG